MEKKNKKLWLLENHFVHYCVSDTGQWAPLGSSLGNAVYSLRVVDFVRRYQKMMHQNLLVNAFIARRLTRLSVVCMDDGNPPVSTRQLIAGSRKTSKEEMEPPCCHVAPFEKCWLHIFNAYPLNKPWLCLVILTY